jgi:phage replication initiation protein
MVSKALFVENGECDSPPTNRGVTHTGIVDWCEFTLPQDVFPHDVFVGFDGSRYIRLPHGAMGYSLQSQCGGVTIFEGGRLDMGIHIRMSGMGCREVEQGRGDFWPGWLRYLCQLGVSFSRLDVALDDKSGGFCMDDIVGSVRAGSVTGDWRHNPQIIEDRGKGDGRLAGCTVYFGSSASDRRLCIYDKAAEQKEKHKHRAGSVGTPIDGLLPAVTYTDDSSINSAGAVVGDGPWIRVEYRTRGKSAGALAALIGNSESVNPLEDVVGLIYRMVDFKQPHLSDSNMSRWLTVDWWACFVGQARKARLVIGRVVQSIDTIREWVERVVAPSLALITRFKGGDVGWLYKCMEEANKRLRPRQLAMLGTSWIPRNMPLGMAL